MRRPWSLLFLLLGACPAPGPSDVVPGYPWDGMRPAISAQLPWSTFVIEERTCGFDPGAAVLVVDEDGGVPLPEWLHARSPANYQHRLSVFRPSWIREDEIAGWLFVVDGASLTPICQVPVEVHSATQDLARVYLEELDKSRARLAQ